MAIIMPPAVNDSGFGTDGTILDVAIWTALGNAIDTAIASAIGVAHPTTAYTPTWTNIGGGSAPVLGNGTLTGRYTKIDKLVIFETVLKIGSTTAIGTGGFWALGLPLMPSPNPIYAMMVLVSAAGGVQVPVQAAASVQAAYGISSSGGSLVGPAFPASFWVANAVCAVGGTYYVT